MPNYELAGGIPAPSRSLSNVDMNAIGMVANVAVASWHSFQMDKIQYQMQKDRLRFQREAQAENRRFRSIMDAMNREKLEEAVYSEKLALDIDSLKATATVHNEAVANNLSAAPTAVRDIQRQISRQSLYKDREIRNRLQAQSVQAVDNTRSTQVLYEPNEPDGMNQAASFVTGALQVGDAAYGRFTKGN